MATFVGLGSCDASRKTSGGPAKRHVAGVARPDAAPPPKVAAILDESSEYVCFAASAEELARLAPGWLIPPPNRKVPIRTNAINPFTQEPFVHIEYSGPNQPKPPKHTAYLDYEAFPRVATGFVEMESLTALFHAIGGGDPDDLVWQLLAQRLVSSGEHEVEILAIPESLAALVARLTSDQIDEVSQRWRPNADQFIDGGLVPVPQPSLNRRRRALQALVRLFSEAAQAKRRVFLFMSDV
ncbi:MAG TPA: hypothetical protein PKA88_11730 [Polyangiaceae bacterium]|nr:hypothetical protein [Polyangiaceae bacterium]